MDKELQEKILAFRFGNRMLFGNWNYKNVHYIRISISKYLGEEIAIQILALITMKEPKNFTNTSIEKEKRKILQCIEEKSNKKFYINTKQWQKTPFYITMSSECDNGIMIAYKPINFYQNDISPGNTIFLSLEKNKGFYITLNYKTPSKNSSKVIRFDYKLAT